MLLVLFDCGFLSHWHLLTRPTVCRPPVFRGRPVCFGPLALHGPLSFQRDMAYPAALHVPPDHARASSSDGGASSVDPGEEAIDIARARSGDRRAIARVVPRIVRRTFRLARRRRRSAAAAVMRANREAVRRAQHDRHLQIRGGAAPPPVECAASLQDIIAPADRCVSAPLAPDPKRPRLTEPPSPPNSGAGGAGAAVAIASSGSEPPINPFVDVTERTAVQPTMLHAVRPPPRMTS